MKGTEKQIAWAKKIIAAREKEVTPANKARWEAAKEKISELGAGFWIDNKVSSAEGIIAAVEAAEKMPELTGTEKQIAYGNRMRLQKLIYTASVAGKDAAVPQLLAEMGKENSTAKSWIEGDALEMAEKAIENLPEEAPAVPAATPAAAASEMKGTAEEIADAERIIAKYRRSAEMRNIPSEQWAAIEKEITARGARAWKDVEFTGIGKLMENFREAPAEISSAGAAKPEPNWANMSADEIAGEYADGMAKIIARNAEFAIEMMDGAEYAINAAADKAADILQKRATKWMQTVSENVAEMLAEGAKSSESPLKVAEELESACVAHAETVARTEMARAREMANLDIMKAQNVEKVQFVASEDERMCPICGQYHGKVYDVGSAPVLPLHPNCRCTLVPYIPEEL